MPLRLDAEVAMNAVPLSVHSAGGVEATKSAVILQPDRTAWFGVLDGRLEHGRPNASTREVAQGG